MVGLVVLDGLTAKLFQVSQHLGERVVGVSFEVTIVDKDSKLFGL